MARFTLSNVDEATMRELKKRAVLHGRSVEEELHEILKAAVIDIPEGQKNIPDHTSARTRRK